MINDTVGRASLLPRLSTSRNRVYPCTGYRSAARTRFLCACTNVRRHPSYQREAPISLSLVRVLSAPRGALISAYDSSNSASGLTTAKEFKMATLGSVESVSFEWQLSILCSCGRFNWMSFGRLMHSGNLCGNRVPRYLRAYRDKTVFHNMTFI